MYSVYESEKIYQAIIDNNLDNYQELIPYQRVLSIIFHKIPLFERLAPLNSLTGSQRFVIEIINLVKRIPVNKVNDILNDHVLYGYTETRIAIFYLNYLKAIISPTSIDDKHSRLEAFKSVFNIYEKVDKIPSINDLDIFLPIAYNYLTNDKYQRLIVILGAACIYYHQDEYDIDELESFYDNYRDYIKQSKDRLMLTFKELKLEYIDEELIEMNLIDEDKLLFLYDSIEYIIKQIKNKGYQKIIK